MKKGLVCFLLFFAIFGIFSSCNNGDIEDIIDDNQDTETPLVEIPCEFIGVNRQSYDSYSVERYTLEGGLLRKMEVTYPEYEEKNSIVFNYTNNRLSGLFFEFSYLDNEENGFDINVEADFEFDNGKLTILKMYYNGSYEDGDYDYDEDLNDFIFEPNGDIIYEVEMSVWEISYEGNNLKQVSYKEAYKDSKNDPNISVSEDEVELTGITHYDFVNNNLVSVKENYFSDYDNEENVRKGPGFIKRKRAKDFLKPYNRKSGNVNTKDLESINDWDVQYNCFYDDRTNPYASFNRDAVNVLGLLGSEDILSVNNVLRIERKFNFSDHTTNASFSYTYNEHGLPVTRILTVGGSDQGGFEQENSTYGYNCN